MKQNELRLTVVIDEKVKKAIKCKAYKEGLTLKEAVGFVLGEWASKTEHRPVAGQDGQ